jgi:hypothetical protein
VVAQLFGGLYAPRGISQNALRALQAACQEGIRSERYVNVSRASQQEVLFRGADAFNQAIAPNTTRCCRRSAAPT